MNNSVVIDMDGVLADFEKAFCEKFGWDNRHLVCLESRYPEKHDLIDLFVNFSGIYGKLDIIDTGVKIARYCENAGWDIRIISRRKEYILQTSASWLQLNKIPFASIAFAYDKLERIKRINPLFVVDDLLEICEACAEEGIPSFLIDHPWNQKEDLDGIIYRIKTFDDFLFVIDNYFDI